MRFRFSRLISTLLASTVLVCAVSASAPEKSASAETAPDKLIALTFDDGPNTTTTNEVLDVLEQYGAVGSFFLIGDNINEESAVSVKRAYDMGCEIDNHSRTHSTMSGMTAEELAEEIGYVDDLVYEITGEHTSFFRPPFIATSQTMFDAIDLPFICGFDCKDFMENVTAEERAEAIITNARDGLIVLLHDAAGNDQTVEALKTVIPTLQAEGYEFVTLNELFERQGETPKGDLIYSCVAKYPCADYTLYREVFSGSATGESGWSGWGEVAVLDGAELTALGDSYAIEVKYDSTDPPVIALQAWSGTSFWQTVLPFYFNGDTACFLASDVQAVLDANAVRLTELDKISIMPYGAEMTMTQVSILTKNSVSSPDLSRLNALFGFLLRRQTTGEGLDCNGDGVVNVFDAAAEKRMLLE